jgi:hypothetical protein
MAGLDGQKRNTPKEHRARFHSTAYFIIKNFKVLFSKSVIILVRYSSKPFLYIHYFGLCFFYLYEKEPTQNLPSWLVVRKYAEKKKKFKKITFGGLFIILAL